MSDKEFGNLLTFEQCYKRFREVIKSTDDSIQDSLDLAGRVLYNLNPLYLESTVERYNEKHPEAPIDYEVIYNLSIVLMRGDK